MVDRHHVHKVRRNLLPRASTCPRVESILPVACAIMSLASAVRDENIPDVKIVSVSVGPGNRADQPHRHFACLPTAFLLRCLSP
jgi:hypothetical protein